MKILNSWLINLLKFMKLYNRKIKLILLSKKIIGHFGPLTKNH